MPVLIRRQGEGNVSEGATPATAGNIAESEGTAAGTLHYGPYTRAPLPAHPDTAIVLYYNFLHCPSVSFWLSVQ